MVVNSPSRKQAAEDKRSLTPKQIRARARRHPERQLTAREMRALRKKPLEEWDLEELARGRPKGKNGKFHGPPPAWVTRDLHERSIELFKARIRTDMQSHTIKAVDLLANLLEDDDVDARGRPVVPAGTKVDIAKFLIEHLIGKPTQPIQSDISIKLQGVLASVLVVPGQNGEYIPSSSHREIEEGIIDAEVVEDDD